jgi:two-component system OmpR family sensor kinase
VDAVMKAHGGYVSVKSKVGEGATFTLHFLNQE